MTFHDDCYVILLCREWLGSHRKKRCKNPKPVVLRGRAASHFCAIPKAERPAYDDATKSMRQALCLKAKRENFFAKFELTTLRPEEDPSVYK